MSQRGFTLVEVLTWLSLVALLAGVVVLAVTGVRTRAKEGACEADLRILKTAVETYRLRTGYNPSNQGILISVSLKDQSSMWIYEPPVDLKAGQPTYSPRPECQL
jgi:type II secretory pathway pseudopilin PulG